MLAPLSNFFAAHVREIGARGEMKLLMVACGEFDEIWEPGDGWIVAEKNLPLSAPQPESLRKNGFVFAEGSAAIREGSGELAEVFFRRLGDLADRHPERLAELPGDFTFLRFEKGGGVIAARACAGLAPLYRSANHQFFSTRLKWMSQLGGHEDLDNLPLAMWTMSADSFPGGRTFLKNVLCMGRGTYFSTQERSEKEYWNPWPTELSTPEAETVEDHIGEFRALLLKSLESNLDPSGGNLLTLSGGVDSTSLAALTSNVLKIPFGALSLVPSPPEVYEREIQFIKNIRKHCRIQPSFELSITEEWRLSHYDALPLAGFPVLHPALLHLPYILKTWQPSVLFGGEFADEIVGSHFTLPDWAAMASIFHLIREWTARRASARDVARLIKQKVLLGMGRIPLRSRMIMPDHINPVLKEEYEYWLEQQENMTQTHRPKFYFEQCFRMTEYTSMNWEALSSVRMRRFLPFFHRDIVEFALRLHPYELLIPRTKKIMRTALKDDVPSMNLMRSDKGAWGQYMGKWSFKLTDEVKIELGGILSKEYEMESRTISMVWAPGLLTMAAYSKGHRSRKGL